MNVRASRVRWGVFALAATATISLFAVGCHRHHDSSSLSSPSIANVANVLNQSARLDESQAVAPLVARHARPATQIAPPAPNAQGCVFGQDRTCNDDASVSAIRGACRHDGSCDCVDGATKTPTGRCR